MTEKLEYDIVIVGSGVAGSIVAKQLVEKGYSVLILEAGYEKGISFQFYRNYIYNFYNNTVKILNCLIQKIQTHHIHL